MRFENPYLLALLIQCINSGSILLSKAVYDQGVSIFVFIFYRQLIGSLSMIPLAISFEWRSLRSLDFRTFCKIFGISLIGVTLTGNLFALGLKFTSSTVGAAILNTVPVMTLAFAVILRMEKVDVRERVGIAKVASIALCIAGAALLAFFRGPDFKPSFLKHHHPLNPSDETHQTDRVHDRSHMSKWLEGCLFSMSALCAWSLGLVLQGQVLEGYPSKLTFSTILCTASAVQSFFVAIAMERELSQWRLGFDLILLVIIFNGIIGTGLLYYLQLWIMKVKGPVFLAMSMPLSLVITSICSMLLLGEAITLASVLGGLLSVGSLYSVLWAKKREEEQKKAANVEAKHMPMEMQGGEEKAVV